MVEKESFDEHLQNVDEIVVASNVRQFMGEQ
jgi:hypothetical protein